MVLSYLGKVGRTLPASMAYGRRVCGYNGTIMSEAKTAIQTTEAPAAIGPYSQAIRIGDYVFTSGQVAIDPATGQLVSGGIEDQTDRVLQNLRAVLAAAGLDFSRVVKTTVFLKDMAHFAAMNAIYAEFLQTQNSPAPARSTVEVARLPKDALVEIELIAC
jgi:2-iminobutanoate/2-iminopropanoate deaminase